MSLECSRGSAFGGHAAIRADQLAELRARAAVGMDFGLDRMRAALAALGDPQDAGCAIHVAGTNGKGSVSAMLEATARAAGLRVGTTTSPHLCRYAERIRIDGNAIDDAAFEAVLDKVMAPKVPRLTFFETLTAAAFVAFEDAKVDVAVVEVGLGGRLDATNVLTAPAATVVTSIGFDHTALLGTTLAAIAREKAGIFKPGAPVVLGPLAAEAEGAALEVAREVAAGPVWRVVSRAGEPVVVGPGVELEVPREVALYGPHQRFNAAVAIGAAHAASAKLPRLSAHLATGLASVEWSGRFERFERAGVSIVLDCAHNPDGAEALAAAIRASGAHPETTTLVFGALADKAWPSMLGTLAPLASRRIYTEPAGRTAAGLDKLAALAEGRAEPSVPAAVDAAIGASRPGELVVITGSAYLVGEVRAHLLGMDRDPPIAL